MHAWNQLISTLQNPHLLQSWEWGVFKAHHGWQAHHLVWVREEQQIKLQKWRPEIKGESVLAAALLLLRAIPAGGFAARMQVAYTPKGPVMDWTDAGLRAQVLDDLKAYAKQQGGIFLKIDADVSVAVGIPGTETEEIPSVGGQVEDMLASTGWQYSQDQIQFRNTVLIDLEPDEDDLLNAMKQKTRYNVRLAERKGVKVRLGIPQDFSMLYRMYAETAVRDGFVIRPESYYIDLWQTFDASGMLEPLIAEVVGEAVAAVVIFRFGETAYYLQGMSRPVHRNKMPTYLLQWEAMRRAKTAGCTTYDLWGAPEVFSEEDSMWGVYRFKEGLAGKVYRHIGAWDFPLKPMIYKAYTQILPRILDVMRSRGMKKNQEIGL